MAGLVAVGVLIAPSISKRLPAKLSSWVVWLVCIATATILFAAVYVPRPGGGEMRREIYGYAVELAREHPVFGIGLGHFQEDVAVVSADNLGFQTYALPYALHAHSLYATAYLELGVIGFIGLVALIGYGIYKMRSTPLLLATFSVILVHGLVDTTFFKADLASIFWLILALGVSLAETKK